MITFKKVMKWTIMGLIFLVLRMFWMAHEENVMPHTINLGRSKGKKRKLTVFFISDIHRRTIKATLLRKIPLPVDAVIIGGDLVEGNVPFERVDHNLQMLRQVGPLFFVWGNNDREIGEEDLRRMLQKQEAVILDNMSVTMPQHEAWGICGTDDPTANTFHLDNALRQTDQYKHLLFVSHQPKVWERVEQVIQPDVMLAGHTHGGQIRLGKYGIDRLGSFDFQHNRAKLLSNGYGTTSIPLRLGAHPESHLLTIYYDEE